MRGDMLVFVILVYCLGEGTVASELIGDIENVQNPILPDDPILEINVAQKQTEYSSIMQHLGGFLCNTNCSPSCVCTTKNYTPSFARTYGLPPPPLEGRDLKEYELFRRGRNEYLSEVEVIAARELKRFEGHTYLDYTGSGLYQSSQISSASMDLIQNAYGNAHSRNPSADLTDQRMSEARKMIFDFFNAEEKDYSVVFTSGATGALKMVGEDFPWTKNSLFYYLRINHNSVLGIREYVAQKGGSFKAISEEELEEVLSAREKKYAEKKGAENSAENGGQNYCLFAYPGKDNFAGKMYPLSWIARIHKVGLSDNCKWRVLLDAAALAAAHFIDVSNFRPDYMAVSFYKMFGYPTGLGVLLLSNADAELWNKVYWGGGTVVAATCDTRWCRMKDSPSLRFEDGTTSFLSIAALKYGLEKLTAFGMGNIANHVRCLGEYLAAEMDEMRHVMGSPVIERYGDMFPEGGIIAFNVLKPDGTYVNFGQVEQRAAAVNIHLRTGCFCNPGGCQDYLGLSVEEIQQTSVTRSSCSDPATMKMAKPLGAVRVSVGYLSTFADVRKLINFLLANFRNTRTFF